MMRKYIGNLIEYITSVSSFLSGGGVCAAGGGAFAPSVSRRFGNLVVGISPRFPWYVVPMLAFLGQHLDRFPTRTQPLFLELSRRLYKRHQLYGNGIT